VHPNLTRKIVKEKNKTIATKAPEDKEAAKNYLISVSFSLGAERLSYRRLTEEVENSKKKR
jgi:hypothetical protein